MTLRDDYTLQPYGAFGVLQFQNGQGVMSRADRRKIGAYLRWRVARYADMHGVTPFAYGMCSAIRRGGRTGEEETIVRYLNKMIRAVLGEYGVFLPLQILGDVAEGNDWAAIRRAWLRHWEETGEVLNHETWYKIEVRLKRQRAYRKRTENRRAERLTLAA
jgi:hypothetical protein